jgi:hypothetical protein
MISTEGDQYFAHYWPFFFLLVRGPSEARLTKGLCPDKTYRGRLKAVMAMPLPMGEGVDYYNNLVFPNDPAVHFVDGDLRDYPQITMTGPARQRLIEWCSRTDWSDRVLIYGLSPGAHDLAWLRREEFLTAFEDPASP